MPSNEKWKKKQSKQVILVAILFLFLAGGVYGYAKYREVSSLLPVSFQPAAGHETEKFYLEIASTPSQRTKGLMFRKSMGADRGMIFIFPEEKHQGFWMKNTYIPLDMIFVSSDFEVIGVSHNAQPLTEARREVPGVSQYVIELNGGVAKKLGIKKGDRVKLHGDIPKPF